MIVTPDPYDGALGGIVSPCRRHVVKYTNGHFVNAVLPAGIVPATKRSMALEAVWRYTADVAVIARYSDLFTNANEFTVGQNGARPYGTCIVNGVALTNQGVVSAVGTWQHFICLWDMEAGGANVRCNV